MVKEELDPKRIELISGFKSHLYINKVCYLDTRYADTKNDKYILSFERGAEGMLLIHNGIFTPKVPDGHTKVYKCYSLVDQYNYDRTKQIYIIIEPPMMVTDVNVVPEYVEAHEI